MYLTFDRVLRDCDSQNLAVLGWLGSRESRFILFSGCPAGNLSCKSGHDLCRAWRRRSCSRLSGPP